MTITDEDIALGHSLILSEFISFDLWLDWRCEMAKRELHNKIDERWRRQQFLEVYEFTGHLMKIAEELYGLPKIYL